MPLPQQGSSTLLDIPGKSNLFSSEEITMDQIEREAVSWAHEHLSNVIESIEKQKAERISKFVQDQAPMLRAVVKYCPEALKEIELNTTDEKMTQTLYAYKGKAEYEIRNKSENLLRTQAKSIDEIDNQYKELTGKLDDFQKDQLAAYVLFRKMIIDLLDKKLCLNKNGKYHNEDIVHDIVFPRKTDTDTIGYENHNLWLIDELLSFHSYAASDKRLCDFTTSSSEERPDVVVLRKSVTTGVRGQYPCSNSKNPSERISTKTPPDSCSGMCGKSAIKGYG